MDGETGVERENKKAIRKEVNSRNKIIVKKYTTIPQRPALKTRGGGEISDNKKERVVVYC